MFLCASGALAWTQLFPCLAWSCDLWVPLSPVTQSCLALWFGLSLLHLDFLWPFSDHQELAMVLQPAQLQCLAWGWQWIWGGFSSSQPRGLGWAGAPAVNTGLRVHGSSAQGAAGRAGSQGKEFHSCPVSSPRGVGAWWTGWSSGWAFICSWTAGPTEVLICLLISALFMYLHIYFDWNGSFSVLPILGSWIGSCVVLEKCLTKL